jgi:acyl-CoA synthetase (NDP forming)
MSDNATIINPTKDESNISNLGPFFYPQTVAVIGAFPKPGNLGKRIIESLRVHGYKGAITAVHPNGLVLPNCATVTEIEKLTTGTDLAIASVSAENVLSIIEPLSKKRIQNLIIIGGGFAEIGEDGEALQTQLKELAKKNGIRIVGPNCLGIFNGENRFNSFFLTPGEIAFPETGPAAVISQSGAFLAMILNQLALRKVGVRKAINFGNRIDIGECEALEAFGADPKIKTIGIYLESVQNGKRFFDIAQKVAQEKHIVIYKGGKGEKGNRATLAHSASLAGSYDVFQAVCKQTGIIEVQGLNELINGLHTLSNSPIPRDNRVLIASNGGGMGVLLADLCEKGGCDLPKPNSKIINELKETLPKYYSFNNPVDITGSGSNEQCVLAIDKLLKTGLFDCLLLVVLSGTEGINENLAPTLKNILPDNFPVALGAYGEKIQKSFKTVFQESGIPTFSTGEEAAWAVNLLMQISSRNRVSFNLPISQDPIYHVEPLQCRLDRPLKNLDEMQLKHILIECGVQAPKRIPATTKNELINAAEEIGYPIILKAVGKDIFHKTELKGVRTNIYHWEKLVEQWEEMKRILPTQIWTEQQVPPGLDLMIGIYRDIQFGPTLLFGTGGQFIEVYKDIGRVILPATNDEIARALLETSIGKIILGARKGQKFDLEKLLAFIELISKWTMMEPRIQSLDFNPIRLYENSLTILDAKIRT